MVLRKQETKTSKYSPKKKAAETYASCFLEA